MNASHFKNTKWRVAIVEVLFKVFFPFDALVRRASRVTGGSSKTIPLR